MRELKVTPNAKMMVVGSTIGDVMKVQAPTADEIKKLQAEKPGNLYFREILFPPLILIIGLTETGVLLTWLIEGVGGMSYIGGHTIGLTS